MRVKKKTSKTFYLNFESNQDSCENILELGIQKINGQQAKKVKVELFYETLCPDVRNFIQDQLYPVWDELSDIMEIHWKPYGFAEVRLTIFPNVKIENQETKHQLSLLNFSEMQS